MVHWWVPGSLWPSTSTVEKKVNWFTRPVRLPMPDTTGQFRTMVKPTMIMMMSNDFGRGAEIGSGRVSSQQLKSGSDV
jgi:hypothetical protein